MISMNYQKKNLLKINHLHDSSRITIKNNDEYPNYYHYSNYYENIIYYILILGEIVLTKIYYIINKNNNILKQN